MVSHDLPHNYIENCVAYRNHDNETIMDGIIQLEKRKGRAIKYLNLTYEEGIAKAYIRGFGHKAYLAIATM